MNIVPGVFMKKYSALVILGLTLILFLFQNCGEQSYTIHQAQKVSSIPVTPTSSSSSSSSSNNNNNNNNNSNSDTVSTAPTMDANPVNSSVPIASVPVVPKALFNVIAPTSAKANETVQILLSYENIQSINYLCKYTYTNSNTSAFYTNTTQPNSLTSGSGVFLTGTINNESAVSLNMLSDFDCSFKALPKPETLAAELDFNIHVELNCDGLYNVNGLCVPFECKHFIQVDNSSDLTSIPARTVEGNCYYYKLLNAITYSSSSLTQTFDYDIRSRSHSSYLTYTAGQVAPPYLMGKANIDFVSQSSRILKLSGDAILSKEIKVDNFMMFGLYPSDTTDFSQLDKYYSARGTQDCSISQSTSVIQFMNQAIPLIPLASGGTASIAPIEISKITEVNKKYHLDLRALDCGGYRELSDIYLLFQ